MSKQSNDCYTDSIQVKISEKYKPPPRINLAVTYAQRLNINKQIQDNLPNYEFSLERTVLDKMNEWKGIRSSVVQDRTDRLLRIREEVTKKKQDQLEQEQVEEIELKTVSEADISTSTSCSQVFGSNISRNYGNSVNDILVPTQIPNLYSNILTPIPLGNFNSPQSHGNQNDKSPFNIKDFENDTSSPFDNMELKSINDMEALAQVLNKDKNNYKVDTPIYSNYPSESSSIAQGQPAYSNYVSQYSFNIPSQTTNYMQPVTDYSRSNGYYYENNSFHSQYMYSKPNSEFYMTSQDPRMSTGSADMKRSNCKSVPDIVKALEDEMDNTHISTSVPKDSFVQNTKASQSVRPKSTDAVYPPPKIKKEELDDPFFRLAKNQQDFCRSISSMGFPLDRVARTCQIVGDDQKKVVDHLLALTDLLDLGFSEKDISTALIHSDNDKDKALDKLIS